MWKEYVSLIEYSAQLLPGGSSFEHLVDLFIDDSTNSRR